MADRNSDDYNGQPEGTTVDRVEFSEEDGEVTVTRTTEQEQPDQEAEQEEQAVPEPEAFGESLPPPPPEPVHYDEPEPAVIDPVPPPPPAVADEPHHTDNGEVDDRPVIELFVKVIKSHFHMPTNCLDFCIHVKTRIIFRVQTQPQNFV